MRVRCTAEAPSDDQIRSLGSAYRVGKTRYPVTRGEEYLVFGLIYLNSVSWIDIEMPTEVVVSVPLFLFEIIDSRASRLWKIKIEPDGLTLWPKEFYDPFFHSRLADGIPEILSGFRQLKERFRKEDGTYPEVG